MSDVYDHARKAGNDYDLHKHACLATILKTMVDLGGSLLDGLCLDAYAGIQESYVLLDGGERYEAVRSLRAADPPGRLRGWLSWAVDETEAGNLLYPSSWKIMRAVLPVRPFAKRVVVNDPHAPSGSAVHDSRYKARDLIYRVYNAGYRASFVLLDPPYMPEDDIDAGIGHAMGAAEQCLRFFPEATVMLWGPSSAILDGLTAYPLKGGPRAISAVAMSPGRRSTVLVLNPPKGLHSALRDTTRYMAEFLGAYEHTYMDGFMAERRTDDD